MRGSPALAILFALPAALGYDCTGKPRTVAELKAQWANAGYDKSTRPSMATRWDGHAGGSKPPMAPPEDIYAVYQINQLQDVDTKAQVLRLETQLRVIWFDQRLKFDADCLQLDAFNSIAFINEDLEKIIWVPDLYFDNEAHLSQTWRNGMYVRPDGRVWWARIFYQHVSCIMDFTFMPFDTQTCNVQLVGNTHTESEIKLKAPTDSNSEGGTKITAPANFNTSVVVTSSGKCKGGTPEWQVSFLNGTAISGGGSDSAVGASYIRFDIRVKRKSEYWVKNTVLPMVLVVFIAWTSFFIARAAVPARVAVGVISFLTLANMMSSVAQTLPKLSGSVWLVDLQMTSMIFVFASIIEYAFANYLMRIEARVEKSAAAAIKRLADAEKATGEPAQGAAASSTAPLEDEINAIKDVAVQITGSARALASAATNMTNKAANAGSQATDKSRAPPKELVSAVKRRLGPADRLLISSHSRNGKPTMWMKDQHLDICCRYFFLVAYGLMMVVFFARLAGMPAQPIVPKFVSDSCHKV